jgi:four helix bundle protein
MEKISNFTDLKVWQEAHKLALLIYKVTEKFPKQELFGLVSQLRRAAVSITSNIAEGFSRTSYKDKLKFYVMAHGSLTEVENQLILAKDLGYLSGEEFETITKQLVYTHKILNSFIASTKARVSS